MKLFIQDRIAIGRILPKEGGYMELATKKDILDKVAISQKELKSVGWVDLKDEKGISNGRAAWNESKDKGLVMDFTDFELELIRKELVELERKKKLNDGTMEIYKLFVKDEQDKKDKKTTGKRGET